MSDFPVQFRQFLYLDRKRADVGLTPSELRRWQKLKRILNQRFSPNTSYERADRRESVRVPVRLEANFESRGALQRCLMTNLSRGGVFLATEEPAEIGTRLELHLRIDDSGERLEIPAEVVSVNVGPDMRPGRSGMGLRFLELKPETAERVQSLYERRLCLAADAAEGGAGGS